MPCRDGIERLAQPREVDRACDAIGHADVEQRPVGVDRLHEPHPVLTRRDARPVDGRYGRPARGPGQAALSDLAAQQFQALLVETSTGPGGVSHATTPTFLALRASGAAPRWERPRAQTSAAPTARWSRRRAARRSIRAR